MLHEYALCTGYNMQVKHNLEAIFMFLGAYMRNKPPIIALQMNTLALNGK